MADTEQRLEGGLGNQYKWFSYKKVHMFYINYSILFILICIIYG